MKHQVEQIAKDFINTRLKDLPGARQEIMRKDIWENMIDKLHLKCNQIELNGWFDQTKNPKWALEDFIQKVVSKHSQFILDQVALTLPENKL